ncbi:hypothetical protein [Trichoplusia ni ascovirus 6b]|nr:hypothetical protein [Trichoplusia ni ascovirus 6b]
MCFGYTPWNIVKKSNHSRRKCALCRMNIPKNTYVVGVRLLPWYRLRPFTHMWCHADCYIHRYCDKDGRYSIEYIFDNWKSVDEIDKIAIRSIAEAMCFK